MYTAGSAFSASVYSIIFVHVGVGDIYIEIDFRALGYLFDCIIITVIIDISIAIIIDNINNDSNINSYCYCYFFWYFYFVTVIIPKII